MRKVVWMFAILLALCGVAFVIAYSGGYNVAADDPHWGVTTRTLSSIRQWSIAARSTDIVVPNLDDRDLIALGAEHYVEMCTGCHLAPGVGDNEMRQGLYPKPPNLSEKRDRKPAETFWIIKHGIKMSGMPAWGVTHDDESIWGLVAFLRQLPTMDAATYAALTHSIGDENDNHGGHEHADHEHDSDNAAEHPGVEDHAETKPADDARNLAQDVSKPTAEHVHADGSSHKH